MILAGMAGRQALSTVLLFEIIAVFMCVLNAGRNIL
jgi:hypothetical protein